MTEPSRQELLRTIIYHIELQNRNKILRLSETKGENSVEFHHNYFQTSELPIHLFQLVMYSITFIIVGLEVSTEYAITGIILIAIAKIWIDEYFTYITIAYLLVTILFTYYFFNSPISAIVLFVTILLIIIIRLDLYRPVFPTFSPVYNHEFLFELDVRKKEGTTEEELREKNREYDELMQFYNIFKEIYPHHEIGKQATYDELFENNVQYFRNPDNSFKIDLYCSSNITGSTGSSTINMFIVFMARWKDQLDKFDVSMGEICHRFFEVDDTIDLLGVEENYGEK